MNAYTAIIGFIGFLTARDESLTLGSTHDASEVVELADAWMKSHGISDEVFQEELL